MPSRPVAVAVDRPSLFLRSLFGTALAVAGLLVFATPAEAQFGKLKKLGSEIGKEVARDAAGLPPEKKDGGSSASARSSRSSADYTITAERVETMIAALTPLMEIAKKEAAAKTLAAGFKTKREGWEKCVHKAGQSITTYSPEYLEKGGAITEQTANMLQRYSAAMQANQQRKVAYLEDSMAVLATVTSAMMSGAKCGAPVYKPAALIEAELARKAGQDPNGEVDESGRTQYSIPESARKGLGYYQFGVLRERIALYALGETGTHRLNTFTAEEQAALDARGAELKAMAPFFRDGAMRWSNPGDLKSW